MPQLSSTPAVRIADQVERLSFQGTTVEVLVGSEATGGEWSLLVYTAPGGFRGLAPHRHRVMTETFFLLSGRLLFRLDDRDLPIAAGETLVVPPGQAHSFSNPCDEPVRMLILCSPGGMEAYFRDVAALVSQRPPWPPVDLDRLEALAEPYDILTP